MPRHLRRPLRRSGARPIQNPKSKTQNRRMDRRLLTHYNNELQYLRSMGAEFAHEFPKIAGRLGLDRDAKEVCPDPFVERLLEGFAFLTARVQLKFNSEFPRFTQS